jgi:aryl carrier-like protein
MLVQWLAENDITVAFVPTVLAEAVLREQMLVTLRLRILHTAGDRLHKSPRNALPFAFYNLYGPTENSVCTTSMLVKASEAEVAPPIGKPIDNVQVYILDTHLQLVGLGVAGELCIAGAGLARGYLRRPELTAETFVPDPFSGRPGARMYRSGDLARYGADGNIEFLARLDSQVKIRGFRVELEDVGTVLRQHSALGEASVAAREVDGEKVLVAYFVAKEMPPSVSEIRSYLRERLPEYMVPSAYVQINRIPLTHSGKVDRAALPPPESIRPALDAVFEKPRTELERQITEIWQDILQLENLGIHDNFFDLGGNSIRMIQVHGKLKAAMGEEVPMVDLFHYPTVSALAQRLSQPRDENWSLTGSHQRAEKRKQLGDKRQLLRKRRAEK